MALRITDPNQMVYFESIARDQAKGHKQQDVIVAEHKLMLDELKRQYNAEGETYIGDLIRQIDPEWKSKWQLRTERDIGDAFCYECGKQDEDCTCNGCN